MSLIAVDLGYIHYQLRGATGQNIELSQTEVTSQSPPLRTAQEKTVSDSIPTFDVDAIIFEATKSLTQRIVVLEANEGNVESAPVPVTLAKEYYIPLGTGTTTATDWTDIGGAEAYVVPANLGHIVEMYFEASVYGQSGRVFVRLRNVTDNIGLFESEISREGMTPALISSGKIPIPTSTKLYRVQMKSAFGSLSTLTNARIKLFIK